MNPSTEMEMKPLKWSMFIWLVSVFKVLALNCFSLPSRMGEKTKWKSFSFLYGSETYICEFNELNVWKDKRKSFEPNWSSNGNSNEYESYALFSSFWQWFMSILRVFSDIGINWLLSLFLCDFRPCMTMIRLAKMTEWEMQSSTLNHILKPWRWIWEASHLAP